MLAISMLDKRQSGSAAASREDSKAVPSAAKDEGSVLACLACRRPITNSSARIAMNGAHEHRFVNPDGYAFEIGCFSRAFGCTTMNPPTLEYTWFSGYAWQFETCGGCGGEIGWLYQSPEHIFHGLILVRLIELD